MYTLPHTEKNLQQTCINTLVEKHWSQTSSGVWVYFWAVNCFILICKDSWQAPQPGVPHTIQDKNVFDLAEAPLGGVPTRFLLLSLLRPTLQSCLVPSIGDSGVGKPFGQIVRQWAFYCPALCLCTWIKPAPGNRRMWEVVRKQEGGSHVPQSHSLSCLTQPFWEGMRPKLNCYSRAQNPNFKAPWDGKQRSRTQGTP